MARLTRALGDVAFAGFIAVVLAMGVSLLGLLGLVFCLLLGTEHVEMPISGD